MPALRQEKSLVCSEIVNVLNGHTSCACNRRREGSASSDGGSEQEDRGRAAATAVVAEAAGVDADMADAEPSPLDSLRQEALKRHQSK